MDHEILPMLSQVVPIGSSAMPLKFGGQLACISKLMPLLIFCNHPSPKTPDNTIAALNLLLNVDVLFRSLNGTRTRGNREAPQRGDVIELVGQPTECHVRSGILEKDYTLAF
jgi:hypothetical protein